MRESERAKKPGAEPERLRIDMPLDEALRRISQAKPPPGGIPERPKRARRGKGTRERNGPGPRG
jgi:hypothetical protein